METFGMFSPADIEALNAEFYSDNPATYLRQRLMLLVAVADESAPMDDVFTKGVRLGKVSVGTRDNASYHPEHDSSGYAPIEAVALAHAVSETLLRHLAAHESLSACPWVELGAFLDPGAVRKYASAIVAASNEALIDRMRPILRGSQDRSDGVSLDVWKADGEAIADLVRAVADCFVTYADANNALKHGVAVLSRTPALRLGKPDEAAGVILDVSGPALKYLNKKRVQKSVHEWHEVTQFVNVEALVAQSVVFLSQLESLWSVAKARYLGDLTGKTALLNPETLQELRTMPTGTRLTGLLSLSMTRKWARPSDGARTS